VEVFPLKINSLCEFIERDDVAYKTKKSCSNLIMPQTGK